MKFITLGNISWRLIYPLFASILLMLVFYPIRKLDFDKQNSNQNLYILILFLSQILGAIPELILYIRKKNSKQLLDSDKEKNKLVKAFYAKVTYIDKSKEKNINNYTKTIIFVILCNILGLLAYCQQGASLKWSNYSYINTLFNLSQILFFMVIAQIILKSKLFFHHIIALIFITIGSLIMLIGCFLAFTQEFSDNFKKGKNWINVLISIGSAICFSLEASIEKILMEKYNFSPYKIIFFNGIVGSIFSIIFLNALGPSLSKILPISSLTQSFKDLFKNLFDKNKIGWILILSVLHFTYIFFYELSIFYYNPCYVAISDFFCCILTLYDYDKKLDEMGKVGKKVILYILYILGYLIVLFSHLVFCEIFIFHICGMDLNTQNFISFRGKAETQIDMIEYLDSLQNESQNENEVDKTNNNINNNIYIF